MKLHELHAIPGANKAVTRKGRGIVCTGNSVQCMKVHYAYTPCY